MADLLAQLVDKDRIVDCLNRLFVGTDRRDGDWRIRLFRFLLKYVDGNLDLERSE